LTLILKSAQARCAKRCTDSSEFRGHYLINNICPIHAGNYAI
jgi:hypothetical protein